MIILLKYLIFCKQVFGSGFTSVGFGSFSGVSPFAQASTGSFLESQPKVDKEQNERERDSSNTEENIIDAEGRHDSNETKITPLDSIISGEEDDELLFQANCRPSVMTF